MQVAQHGPPPDPGHRTAESEPAVWVMIVILVGAAIFALVSLLEKVGG